MNVSSISVIIPVYQSAERLPVHIESLRRLRPIVHEFIWVITESPDRSHEIAREAAKELGGQILEVPCGLYQAWNAGIARASGEFIYISTIGDTITPQGLSALFHCLQKAEADVVFSPPAIFPVTKSNLKRSRHWPVFRFARILKQYAGGRLPKERAILIQILSGASGLLGSCASCLFRASFLLSRPFATDHYHYGDTVWSYQNLPEATLAFYPDTVARFTIHDSAIHRIVDKIKIYGLMNQLAKALPPERCAWVRSLTLSMGKIDAIRDPHPKYGWWINPSAWIWRLNRDKNTNLLFKSLKEFHNSSLRTSFSSEGLGSQSCDPTKESP